MSTLQAKEFFQDAIEHTDPVAEPVMWNLTNGLWQLTEAVEQLQNEVALLRQGR